MSLFLAITVSQEVLYFFRFSLLKISLFLEVIRGLHLTLKGFNKNI